jgi:hypothetical protein
LREAKEIEVIRKGKKTNSQKLENGDIIKMSRQPTLFDMRGYIS